MATINSHDWGIESVFRDVQFSAATGEHLDRIAEMAGVPTRRPAETNAEYRKRVTETLVCKPKDDPWAVVGTTTIDGTFEQVREAFGASWENIEHMQYMTASGDVYNVGGRSLEMVTMRVADGGVIVHCDIVRRQSEIDAEARLRPCVNCETLTDMMFCAECTDAARTAEVRPQCPECGPHGNRGRVVLASSEVACTTCAGGVPGDAFGRVAQDEIDIDEEVRRVLEKDDSPKVRFTMGERVTVVATGCIGTGTILAHDPLDTSLHWHVRYDDDGPHAGTQLWFSDREVEKV